TALRRLDSPEAHRFLECIFACLAEAGFDAPMRAGGMRLITQWAVGAALGELASRPRVPHPEAADAIDAARYPLTRETAPYLMPDQLQPTWDFSLDTILDAVERAPRKAPRARKPALRTR